METRTYDLYIRVPNACVVDTEVRADEVEVGPDHARFFRNGRLVYAVAGCPLTVRLVPEPDPVEMIRDDLDKDELESLGIDPALVSP